MNTVALKGKSVWITGASSGIGLEMTKIAARAGAHLHLFSSREALLQDAVHQADGAKSAAYSVVDLSDPEQTASVTEQVLQTAGAPDFLILNAGVSQRSPAAETSLEVTRKILELNFFGAVSMARTVLPAMIAKGGGNIGVTSSVTGIFGFPMRSAYAASKHALHGYFESVALEYASDGIRVTLAVPGRIHTPISIRSLRGDGKHHGKMDPGQAKGMDAAVCASRYWKAVIRGRREVIIGKADTVMVPLRRCCYPLFRLIARKASPL